MNLTAHQEKDKNEATKKGKRRAGEEKKRENRQPILKKLCAALLDNLHFSRCPKSNQTVNLNII